MKACLVIVSAALFLFTPVAGQVRGGPPIREEGERRQKLVDTLKKSLAAETTDAGKAAVLAKAMKDEPNPNVRRVVLDAIGPLSGAELDKFLTDVLTGDSDAGIRSQAAVALGHLGSEKTLAALGAAAKSDKTTDILMGDIGGRSSARRPATFAIAELAARFPKSADDAAVILRALSPAADTKDSESLADARLQALYQITRDEKLLKPFYERLKSREAPERVSGVVAFRFLKLKSAPPELLAAQKDDDREVRSWANFVVNEITAPKAAPRP
ncbi:HEAT repeat domain-containing protein [Zavarzinella formosa]|uniref:HEAT repeat domain-containing protein n=1 Tax=Zavarzinella formosa TaxID=360055 RepID=UPI00031962CB|nr:HEAT repeat domain-containing protein [Zavarzinella formosa]